MGRAIAVARPVLAPAECALARAQREERAARLTRLAEAAAGAGHRDPAAGLRHLADLHAHCPRRYPSMAVAAGYESGILPYRGVPEVPAGGIGSSAAMCAEAGLRQAPHPQKGVKLSAGRPRKTS